MRVANHVFRPVPHGLDGFGWLIQLTAHGRWAPWNMWSPVSCWVRDIFQGPRFAVFSNKNAVRPLHSGCLGLCQFSSCRFSPCLIQVAGNAYPKSRRSLVGIAKSPLCSHHCRIPTMKARVRVCGTPKSAAFSSLNRTLSSSWEGRAQKAVGARTPVVHARHAALGTRRGAMYSS